MVQLTVQLTHTEIFYLQREKINRNSKEKIWFTVRFNLKDMVIFWMIVNLTMYEMGF